MGIDSKGTARKSNKRDRRTSEKREVFFKVPRRQRYNRYSFRLCDAAAGGSAEVTQRHYRFPERRRSSNSMNFRKSKSIALQKRRN